jgi:hypothetical protein
VNRHCCVGNTHALGHKTLNAHAQIRKTDLNPGLEKPGQSKKFNLVPRAFFENAAKGKGPGTGWLLLQFHWSTASHS